MGVRIIAEPGRYFAASAFTLAVNIIAKRTISSSDSTSSSPGDLCLSDQLSFLLELGLYRAYISCSCCIPPPLKARRAVEKLVFSVFNVVIVACYYSVLAVCS